MTNDKQARFHRRFRDLGGRLDEESEAGHWIHEAARLVFDMHMKAGSVSPIPMVRQVYQHVHIDIIDNNSVNAIAAMDDDLSHIGIYAGTVFACWDLAHAIMRISTVWPEAVTTDNPISRPLIRAALQFRFALYKSDSVSGLPELLASPDDPLREEIATLAARYAISFIIEHELIHIGRGHLDTLNRMLGFTELVEAYSDVPEEEIAYILKGMEVDADVRAVKQFAHSLPPNSAETIYERAIRSRISTGEIASRAQRLALCIFILLADYGGPPPEEYRCRSHPHPLFRQMYLFSEHASILTEHVGFSGQEAKRIVTDGYRDYVKVIQLLGQSSLVSVKDSRGFHEEITRCETALSHVDLEDGTNRLERRWTHKL